MSARVETSPERVRRMLGIEPGAVRREPTEAERAQVVAIRQKVLGEQQVVNDTLRAILLMNAPEVMANVLEMAAGRKGAPSTQLTAAMWWLTEARGEKLQLDGRPLNELPLDQLETVLTSALDATRQLRSVDGQSQRVEEPQEVVPISGTSTPE